MVTNEYMKRYMEDKTRIIVKDNVKDMFNSIKNRRNLNSDSETLKYLCDIEKKVCESELIEDLAICEDCDEVKTLDYIGKYHNEVDKNSNCFGRFQAKFRIKTGLRTKNELSDTTELKNDTTDQSPFRKVPFNPFKKGWSGPQDNGI